MGDLLALAFHPRDRCSLCAVHTRRVIGFDSLSLLRRVDPLASESNSFCCHESSIAKAHDFGKC